MPHAVVFDTYLRRYGRQQIV